MSSLENLSKYCTVGAGIFTRHTRKAQLHRRIISAKGLHSLPCVQHSKAEQRMSHIMVWRGRGREDGFGGFWHHGILCSDGSVVHYTGMDGVKTLRNASVLRTSMTEFDGGSRNHIHYISYNVREHLHIFPPEEVQRRAESRIEQRSYHVLFDNCESFARWCVVGDEISFQGRGVVVGAIAGFGSIVLGGGLLGAGITAVVVQKFWDSRGNRSSGRRMLGDPDDSDSDDD